MAKKKRPAPQAPAADPGPEVAPSGRWASPLLVLPVLAVAFFPCLRGSLLLRDCMQFFAPNKYLMAQALRHGRIHQWYPWQLLGMPFVADIQSSWFYPLNVLYVILPFEPAHRLYVLAHYPMAALFLWLFLRGRGVPRIPALLGGIVFSLSGYLVCQHATVTMLIGLAWAPLALHLAGRAVAGSIGAAAGTGAVLAMQVLGGDPQGALITAVIVFFLGLGRALARPRRAGPLVAVAAAGVASLALAAVQILPTWEMMRLSVRSGGVDASQSTIFSFHPGRVVELLWATPFGGLWPVRTFWASFVVDGTFSNIPWAVTNYLGLPALTLAAIGAFGSRRSLRRPVAAAGALFFVTALGSHTPVFGLLHGGFSLLSFFRYPEKYMGWFAGCVAILAALGLERLVEWMGPRAASVVRGTWTYLAGVVLLVLLSAAIWPAVVARGTRSADPKARDLAVSHLVAGGAQLVVVSAAAALLVLAIARRRVGADAGLAALVALLTADLALANVRTVPVGPPDVYDAKPLAAEILSPGGRPNLGEFRIFREQMEYGSEPWWTPYRFVRQRVWERATLKRNFDAMEGFEDVVGYNAGQLAQGFGILRFNLTPQVLEILNVRYVLSPPSGKPFGSIRQEKLYASAENELVVTRLPDARPRAYFTASARFVPTEEQAAQALLSPEAAGSVVLVGAAKDPPGPPGIVPVEVTRYEPDRVALTSVSETAGWVVLSDRWYPGWSATLDGEPATIERANVMVRAVEVPAGRHEIVFTYRSRLFATGAWISAVAWLALLAGWLISHRPRPRTPAPVLPDLADARAPA